jgi:uncharacterized protein (TIGR03067 family)
MKQGLTLVLMAAFLAAAADHQTDNATQEFQILDSDAQKIQGTWVVVSLERGGQQEQGVQGTRIVFKEDKCLTQEPGQAIEVLGRFRLHPTKSPKWIDVTHSNGGGKSQTCYGIYTLHGNELKLCGGGRGDQRPTKFASAVGTSLEVWVLKREKGSR